MRFKDRLGEEKYNNQGCLMKIIEYNNAHDMIIEFQDKYKYRKKALLGNWVKGSISNPFFPNVYGVGYLGTEKRTESMNKFYNIWRNMLKRCYDEKSKEYAKSYGDCTVCDEWHNFQNFKQWCIKNYYEVKDSKMQLDKDILVRNNKIYSPNTCCFVPDDINKLFVGINNNLCGISWDKDRRKWSSNCNKNGELQHLGRFNNLSEAILAYNHFKENLIKEKARSYKEYLPNYIYDVLMDYKINFKVYSVVEYGGEYEDGYSRTVKTFASKAKAEAKMDELWKTEYEQRELAKQCANCPCLEYIENNKALENLMCGYCDHSDIHYDDDGELFCGNFYSHWADNTYRIEEVEVNE